MGYLISLEGNIGSGKESIINLIKKYFTDDITFFDDTIYNWENETLLKNFYKDPERWAFTLEVYSTSQKCKRLKNLNYDNDFVIITKRSPISDKECFVKTCEEMEYMTKKELDIYNNLFETFKIPKYKGIIYLKSNINKCYENIITKQTGLENIINFKYIQTLNNIYEKWIDKLIKENIPVLVIDIEKYRDIDGSERMQEELVSILIDYFPFLKNFIKTRQYGKKEVKWTLVQNKNKTKHT